MASHGTLPFYYKNSRPTGLSAGPGKSWKDNYLLVVVFMGFVVLIAGTFWFLPPLDDKDSDYEKTYGRFAGNAAITDAVVIPTEPTLVPSEEPGRRGKEEREEKDWEGEREGGEGGRKEGREIMEVVKQPVPLEDLIKEDKLVQIFDKNPQPPAHGPPETSQTHQTTKPPETTRPPETTQPPSPPASESVEMGQQSREDGNGEEPGTGEGGATDPGVEEKRRKIIEVGSVFSTIKIAEWWGKVLRFQYIANPTIPHCLQYKINGSKNN